MDTFDKWWEENYGEFSGQSAQTKRKMNMAYDVGVEHQQAKVEGLQKRIDTALEKIDRFYKDGCLFHEWVYVAEQALKGGGAPNLNTDDKGECRHFSTTMFHEGKAECFHCDAVVNGDREIIGKQSKGFSWPAKERDQ